MSLNDSTAIYGKSWKLDVKAKKAKHKLKAIKNKS